MEDVAFWLCSLDHAKKSYMNNTDALILALMSLNAIQVHLFFSLGHSHLHIWSLLGSACLPILIMYFYLTPQKCLVKLKGFCSSTSLLRKVFCYCFKDEAMQEREISRSASFDPDRRVHSERYPNAGSIQKSSAENDALLHDANCANKPIHLYLSIN